MMNLAHLNEIQISELALMLDEEFPEFVRTFISHSENLILILKQQLKARDTDGFITSIHSLKGSCRNVGAEQLADYCLQMETVARNASITSVDTDFISFDKEFEQLKSTLIKVARI